jgi:transposase-like protein
MKIDPIQKLTEAIRNHGIFKRNKKPIEEKALALLLYMSGLSSWQISEQLGISHASVLYWARAFSSIMLDVPAKERKLIAVDETELKVNGDTVYVWAAVDYDTRELLAIKATKGRSAFDAMLFLKEVLKKCTNQRSSLTEVLGTNGLLKFLDLIIMKRSARRTG